jgi:hypothetical protein
VKTKIQSSEERTEDGGGKRTRQLVKVSSLRWAVDTHVCVVTIFSIVAMFTEKQTHVNCIV